MTEQPDRLPPGHVERRQVSNEVLAFQLNTLQESQTTQWALLRDDIKEGFDRMQRVLDKHTDQIAAINVQLSNIDARTTALEAFRSEVETAAHEESKRIAAEARSTSADADQLRTVRLLIGILIGVLTIGTGILAMVSGVG